MYSRCRNIIAMLYVLTVFFVCFFEGRFSAEFVQFTFILPAFLIMLGMTLNFW
jgi:hypothetical protein